MFLDLHYSNTNGATYQVPLFFVVTDRGPNNKIVFVKDAEDFIKKFGNKPLMLEESYVYAYRTAMLTPIYCCKLAPVDYINPNLVFAITNYSNTYYIMPGYIGKDYLFYPYYTLQNKFASTSLYQVLFSISSLYGGTDYIARIVMRNNYLYFMNAFDTDVMPFINKNVYSNYYVMENYSFTITQTNINILTQLPDTFESYTYIDHNILFRIISNIFRSNTMQLYTNANLFIRNNSIDEEAFLTALASITNDEYYYIKYVIAPIQIHFSSSFIYAINQTLFRFCLNQQQNYLGSLLYTFVKSASEIINSNLIVSYTHIQKTYLPELGKLAFVPIHYDAAYKIIDFRLQTNDNSTTLLTFNDIYQHHIPTYTNQYAIHINASGISSFTVYNINQIVNTYKGPAQTVFRTTYQSNNMLVFEYVNADILDLLHRLYKVLVPIKHKLYQNSDFIKQLVKYVITNYHETMIEEFNVYFKDLVYEHNMISIVIRLKYKRIADTVDITMRI